MYLHRAVRIRESIGQKRARPWVVPESSELGSIVRGGVGSVAPGGRQQFFCPFFPTLRSMLPSSMDRGEKGKERGRLEPWCHPLVSWPGGLQKMYCTIRTCANTDTTSERRGLRFSGGDAVSVMQQVWRDRISLFCQTFDASYCRVGVPILRRLCFPGFLFGCNLFRNAWSIVCLPRRGPRCFKQPHSSFSTSALEPTSLVDSIAQR